MAELVVTDSVNPVGRGWRGLVFPFVLKSLKQSVRVPQQICSPGASSVPWHFSWGELPPAPRQGLYGGVGQCPHVLLGVSWMKAAGQGGSCLCKAWARQQLG